MESYTCTEYINIQNLNKIIASKRVDDETMTKLNNIKRRLKKSPSHQIKFIPKERIHKTKGVGRLYPSHNIQTLQDMPRAVRKALAYDQYSDLDIVNCHPVVLDQVFKENGIPCASLEKYVLHRELMLSESGMPRAEAKDAFIRLMYGGKPKEQYNTYMKQFYDEFNKASTLLLNTAKYNQYRLLGELKKPTNPIGHAMSSLAQDKERAIITQVINTLQEAGYETSTLIHDGFHIRSLNVKDEDIRQAERNVKMVCGYDIALEVKPMNDFNPDELWDDADIGMAEAGDHESARLFLEWAVQQGHHFVKCKRTTYWYNPDHGIWNSDLDDLRHLIAKCPVISIEYRQMAKRKDALIKELNVKRDDDFLFNAMRTTYRKLAFRNGVWDFEIGKLVPFSHEYTFFYKAPIEYKPAKNADVYQKLFVDVFGEEKAKYVLKCISRSLAGEIYDKTFFNVVGETNSGKGCLSDMLIAAFGDFIGTINNGVLKASQINGDQAKARSWMCPLKDARMIISNEIKMDQELDASIIKTLSSGGDTIVARQNFQNEATFVLQATCWLFMNDMPKIRGCDEATSNRMRFVSTEYSYLEREDYEKHKHNSYVRKADTTIKSHFIKRAEIIQAFTHLVLTSYCREKPICPKVVADENLEWTSKDDIKTQISNLFVSTNEESDFLTLKTLSGIAKREGLDVSPVRISKILKGFGYTVRDKKVDGKSQKCVICIKRVFDAEPVDF